MKIAALQSWTPRPGRALHWTPTARSLAAATAAPVHPDPTTFLSENHIRTSRATRLAGQAHRAYLGSGTEIDGTLDHERMASALTVFVRRHTALRTWYSGEGANVEPHLVATEDIEFTAEDVGPIDSPQDLHTHLTDRFSSEAICDSYPGFVFGAISAPRSFALFFGCDHALSDGVSQALALTEIIEIYQTLATTQIPEAAEADFFAYAAIEAASTAEHLAGSEEWTAWKEIFARNGSAMPTFPLGLGLGANETAPVRPLVLDILDQDQIEQFDAACKSVGARFVAGVYAALAITDHEVAGRDRYFGMTVLNARTAIPELAATQGWFTAFAPVEFPITESRSFRELLGVAELGYLQAKQLGTVPVAAALAALAAAGASPGEVVSAPNLLSYIDFRHFPGGGTQAYDEGTIFTGEGRTANASMWINRDHHRLYLGSQTPDTPFAQHQVRRYFAHLRQVIRRVADTGDYAISATATTVATGADSPRNTECA